MNRSFPKYFLSAIIGIFNLPTYSVLASYKHEEATNIATRISRFQLNTRTHEQIADIPTLVTSITKLQNEVENLQKKFDSLSIEYNNLNINLNKNLVLKNDNKFLKGSFWNINYDDWLPYTEAKWKPLIFNQFSGDERLRCNLSVITLPEDGLYSLNVTDCWKADPLNTVICYTGIALNNVDNIIPFFRQYTLAPNIQAAESLNRTQRFKKGDKIMFSVKSGPNVLYHLKYFKFFIDKLD